MKIPMKASVFNPATVRVDRGFGDVFLSTCSDFFNRILFVLNTLLPEGLKITVI